MSAALTLDGMGREAVGAHVGKDMAMAAAAANDNGALLVPLAPMIAPLRFAIVAQAANIQPPSASDNTATSAQHQSLYKGSFPRKRHLPFLSRLKLKSILSLTPKPIDAVDADMAAWCTSRGVQMHHIRCDKPKDDGGGLSREGAAKALRVLLDSRNLPLYAHCLDGASVSTLLVAVLRKVQAWSAGAIQGELVRTIGHDDEIISYQMTFVDKFGKPDGVRLPCRRFMPSWTWQDPSPLRRLCDPYDVVAPKEKAAVAAEAPSIDGFEQSHRRQQSIDSVASLGGGGGGGTATGSPLQYGMGSLPVQHPTLRLKFDLDPDLPPPTPIVLTTPQLGHSRDNSNAALQSPSPSRPSSRSGRSHGAANMHHGSHVHAWHTSEGPSRASSRPGSPRRRLLTAELLHTLEGKRIAAAAAASQQQPIDGRSNTSSPDHMPAPTFAAGTASPSSRSPRLGGQSDLPPTASIASDHHAHGPSHLHDVFSTAGQQFASHHSAPESLSSTPRPSSGLLAVQPHSLRGAVNGLGLQDGPALSHPTLSRSVSDQTTRSGVQTSGDINGTAPDALDEGEENGQEYYSDPESLDEGGSAQRTGRPVILTTNFEREAAAAESDKEEEEEEEVSEEEDEEESEEDEEDEEDDSDADEDGSDNLALEALDLDGY